MWRRCSDDHASITLNALGSDTLTASLRCDAAKSDTAEVSCQSKVGPMSGSLGIVEKTQTGGFIAVGSEAEYAGYIDENENGVLDEGETILATMRSSGRPRTGR